MRRFSFLPLAAVWAVALAAAEPPPFAGPDASGSLPAGTKDETSGLAASRRSADLLWLLDDSGNAPLLHGFSRDGAVRGRLQVGGVKNEDWEDLAAVELDGRAWLVVGDVGDNDAKRAGLAVHFVAEPAPEELSPAAPRAERPAATLRLRFEDGARDCESIAVDPAERALYLLSKRDDVPRLYRVVLPAPLASGDFTARFVGLVPHLPKPTGAQSILKGHLGKRRAQPCAMDFAPDGSGAVVLTYGDVLWFPRRAGQPWAEALALPPVRLAEHNLPQAEAACFARDGSAIYVASESTRRLLRYDRR